MNRVLSLRAHGRARRSSLAGVLAGTVLSAAFVAAVPTASATVTPVPKAVNGATITETVRTAISKLPVRAEVRTGYVRTAFKLWDDADHDCQNTRSEVLRAETLRPVTGACAVRTGRWVSQYDGVVTDTASAFDIDHLVPLAEAWDSGARSWTAQRREAYANDLTDPRTLIAVSASANRAKGDGDPADWMPRLHPCKYVVQWTVVKTRWRLSVDAAEKAALQRIAAACPNTRFTTHYARVVTTGTTSGGTSGGTGGLDPRFSTCTEAKAHGYGPYYQGRDPEYSWYIDRDHDGIVCE